mmetsp:Transcript_12410/g.31772  ORF Transcript_12410/g.31772 Transcript_12410/m.31772 type:complete len:231 (+) Transcript_12410:604-1296(+)
MRLTVMRFSSTDLHDSSALRKRKRVRCLGLRDVRRREATMPTPPISLSSVPKSDRSPSNPPALSLSRRVRPRTISTSPAMSVSSSCCRLILLASCATVASARCTCSSGATIAEFGDADRKSPSISSGYLRMRCTGRSRCDWIGSFEPSVACHASSACWKAASDRRAASVDSCAGWLAQYGAYTVKKSVDTRVRQICSTQPSSSTADGTSLSSGGVPDAGTAATSSEKRVA